MKLLKGEKVKLRAIEPEDVDRLVDWENETEHWEVSGTISPFSREIIRRYVASAHQDIYEAGQLRMMIDEVCSGETIGTIDIFDFDAFHHRAGLGILIADSAKRNNGYAGEAVELVKEYCFKHLGLQQLFCNILEGNKGSLRLFEKAGFKCTGTRHKWVRQGAEYHNQLFLQLLRE